MRDLTPPRPSHPAPASQNSLHRAHNMRQNLPLVLQASTTRWRTAALYNHGFNQPGPHFMGPREHPRSVFGSPRCNAENAPNRSVLRDRRPLVLQDDRFRPPGVHHRLHRHTIPGFNRAFISRSLNRYWPSWSCVPIPRPTYPGQSKTLCGRAAQPRRKRQNSQLPTPNLSASSRFLRHLHKLRVSLLTSPIGTATAESP